MSISKNKKILNICLIVFILSFFVFPFVQTTKAQLSTQWWLEYKDISGIHQIQGPDKDEATCKSDWTNNFVFGETLVKDCFQSATKPAITPETCTWPQVLDPKTGTCVNPAVTCTAPQVLDPKTNTCVNPSVNTDTTYKPLASLPGLPQTIDTLYNKDTNPCPFGNYLNILIKIFLGICGVLAVIMIVWGGIQYMTSELASSKEAGKESITHAILGLLLALGAFVILNTLNPNLLNICLNNLPTATIIITPDDLYNAKTEEPIKSTGTGYQLIGTFASPSPTPGILDFKKKLDQGYKLTLIDVVTSTKTAYFYASNGSDQQIVPIRINIGQGGVSDATTAKEGDGKTPKGTTYITSDRRPPPTPPINGKAAATRDNTYNMGAAFINYGATINGKDRGMGFHGRFESGLGGTTNGCIRMSNDDLVVLAPYMTSGLKILIE